MLTHAGGAARWLSEAGLPEGVPVPALLEASPEALALVLAGAATRRPIAPLGPRLTALAAGASIVAVPRFTVAAWRELEPLGVTHALAVHTMVEMLLRQGALPLRTLQVMQYGASPIHPDTLRTAMGQLPGAGFLTLYGQTEGSPITWLSPEDHRLAAAGREELLASVGRAAPGVEVHLEDSGGSGPAR